MVAKAYAKQKPMYRPFFINKIPNIEQKSYLEVGVAGGNTFFKIKAKSKVGVDICSEVATYIMSSDSFFKQNNDKFDIIFIDADHRHEQVLRDFNNAVSCLTPTGIILVHDLIPCDVEHTQVGNCGDGYKMLATALLSGVDILCCVWEDEGLTIFRHPQKIRYDLIDLDYFDFINNFVPGLPVMSFEDAEKVIHLCWG